MSPIDKQQDPHISSSMTSTTTTPSSRDDARKTNASPKDTNAGAGDEAAATKKNERSATESPSLAAPIQTKINEKIGCVLNEFECQHNNCTGILYVGPLGVVFLGSFLFLEFFVVLKWEAVVKIERWKSTDGNSDKENENESESQRQTVIRIETTTSPEQEKGVYDFDGFSDHRSALEALTRLHSDSLPGNPPGLITPGRASIRPRHMVRAHSDPARMSAIFRFGDPPLAATAPVREEAEAMPRAVEESPGRDAPERQVMRRQSSVSVPAAPNLCGGLATGTKAAAMLEEDEGEASGRDNGQLLRAEWEAALVEVRALPQVAVQNRELPRNASQNGERQDLLDALVESFFRNDATHGMGRYMTDVVGDTDVEATDWTDDDKPASENERATSSARVQSRTIHYTHPVNAPMAPPTARAEKKQTLRHYGSANGLMVETKTIVKGVPKTDCFYVKDVLCIEMVPDDKRGDRLVFSIRFDIVFVKSTFFEGIISNTTKGEFQTFMNGLADFLCEHWCSGGTSDTATVGGAVPRPASPKEPAENTTTNAAPLLSLPGPSAPKQPPAGTKPTLGDAAWKSFCVVLLLWIAFVQSLMWNEVRTVRKEWDEWKQNHGAAALGAKLDRIEALLANPPPERDETKDGTIPGEGESKRCRSEEREGTAGRDL